MSKQSHKPGVGIQLTGSTAIGFSPAAIAVGQNAVIDDESTLAVSDSDFAAATSNLAGYAFGYSGSARGCAVTNNSTSAPNGKNRTAGVHCIRGYAGATDHVGRRHHGHQVGTNLSHPRGSSGKRPGILVGAYRTPVSEGRIRAPIRANHAEEAPQ